MTEDRITAADMRPTPDFLPVRPNELGNAPPDFVLVTGDAYVDHPSFGAALIGKLLWAHGYTVGVIPQPNWKDAAAFRVFGRPKLGFLVTSGGVDAMVNNYTSAKRKRTHDDYAPGGKPGLRPDRALCVYCRKIRDIYGQIPIVAGGLEASLRRLTHYDYWADAPRKPILLDAGADIVVYGMGERQAVAIANLLAAGVPVRDIAYLPGTVTKPPSWRGVARSAGGRPQDGPIVLPNWHEVVADNALFAQSFKIQYDNANYKTAKPLAEVYGDTAVVQNPPAAPLDTDELDAVYAMNFARAAHPMYTKPVPSIEEVRFSVTAHRGCFGACNFCALTFHQGRILTARSDASILAEAEAITRLPGFKGYIHDVGGPTANFHHPACPGQEKRGACPGKRCMDCDRLDTSHTAYIDLLRNLRNVPGVKKAFVRSGVRYDYVMMDKGGAFLEELCRHHVSGQLKVAPEHVSDNVLRLMGKPGKAVYGRFTEAYRRVNEKIGKPQYLVPYLMSGHPGSGLKEAVELAEYLRDHHVRPEQVQDFYPTPGTASTCMYFTGRDPFTGKTVCVARDPREKAMQRALIQYSLPQNRELVRAALIKAGRKDLIGFGPKCLIKPAHNSSPNHLSKKGSK